MLTRNIVNIKTIQTGIVSEDFSEKQEIIIKYDNPSKDDFRSVERKIFNTSTSIQEYKWRIRIRILTNKSTKNFVYIMKVWYIPFLKKRRMQIKAYKKLKNGRLSNGEMLITTTNGKIISRYEERFVNYCTDDSYV